jgi:hypothetical protein
MICRKTGYTPLGFQPRLLPTPPEAHFDAILADSAAAKEDARGTLTTASADSCPLRPRRAAEIRLSPGSRPGK